MEGSDMEKRPILPPDPVEAALLTEEIEARKTVPSDGEEIDDSQIQGEGEALDETRKAAQRGRTA
jgi:hypothetical protein